MTNVITRTVLLSLILAASASAQDLMIYIGAEAYPAHINIDDTFEWLQAAPEGWDEEAWVDEGPEGMEVVFGSQFLQLVEGYEGGGEVRENGQMEIGSWDWVELQ